MIRAKNIRKKRTPIRYSPPQGSARLVTASIIAAGVLILLGGSWGSSGNKANPTGRQVHAIIARSSIPKQPLLGPRSVTRLLSLTNLTMHHKNAEIHTLKIIRRF